MCARRPASPTAYQRAINRDATPTNTVLFFTTIFVPLSTEKSDDDQSAFYFFSTFYTNCIKILFRQNSVANFFFVDLQML